jgi:YegS/Rv2252/BmrU family lipid kinase
MNSSVVVIVNASSGKGHEQQLCEQLRGLFRDHGVDAQVHLAARPSDLKTTVRQALDEGCGTLVAGGGDGTVSAVAGHLLGTDATLGVLPLGTLNHFAKDLGVPSQIEEAVNTVCKGRTVHVDAGQVNDLCFINNASIGLYPRIVRHRERQQQRLGRGKWPAFAWATLSAFRRFPMLDVRVQVDGLVQRRHTPFVFVGNNVYEMEGFEIGARPRLDGGCLSLYTVQRPTRMGLLRLAGRALFHRLRQSREFDAWRAGDIVIETGEREVAVGIDGEIHVLPAPLCLRTLPAALRVRVPAA